MLLITFGDNSRNKNSIPTPERTSSNEDTMPRKYLNGTEVGISIR